MGIPPCPRNPVLRGRGAWRERRASSPQGRQMVETPPEPVRPAKGQPSSLFPSPRAEPEGAAMDDGHRRARRGTARPGGAAGTELGGHPPPAWPMRCVPGGKRGCGWPAEPPLGRPAAVVCGPRARRRSPDMRPLPGRHGTAAAAHAVSEAGETQDRPAPVPSQAECIPGARPRARARRGRATRRLEGAAL